MDQTQRVGSIGPFNFQHTTMFSIIITDNSRGGIIPNERMNETATVRASLLRASCPLAIAREVAPVCAARASVPEVPSARAARTRRDPERVQ